MKAFFVRRVIGLVATVLLVSMVTFLVLNVLPGDPALIMLGTEAEPEALDALRQELGLDKPVPVRFAVWFTNTLRGDLGLSYRYNVPVRDLIGEGLPLTITLALSSVVLSFVLAVAWGVCAAGKVGTIIDTIILGITQIGLSLPSFWVGLLLIYLFAVQLRIFPPGGYSLVTSRLHAMQTLFLPVLALSFPRTAILTRMVRSTVLDELSCDYIRTARSKGLGKQAILYRHALRNALIPILTITGLHFTQLLAGSIVVEQVFSLPGLGRLMVIAVGQRDLPVVQALVFVGTILIVAFNFVMDFVYAVADPRAVLFQEGGR